MIGPQSSSSSSAPIDFTFSPASAASDYIILLLDANGASNPLDGLPFEVTGSTVPLPAALPLMGSVLGAGWLVSIWRRRKRRASTADASVPA